MTTVSHSSRAVAYVRMSTDDQRISIENQRHWIHEYAVKRNLELVRTYTDEGISGLTIESRKALQMLLHEVQSGAADFSTILVYDVSRWGRFQNVDEAAYYEHTCARAGISVQYCAELFENDLSLETALLKTLKRAMAAEFSRELSLRVFYGKSQSAKRGYRQGGRAGYGFRRLAVDGTGRPVQLLEEGDRKFQISHRVILVHGPEEEIDLIKRIFDLFVYQRYSMPKIAKTLNAEGVGLSPFWDRRRIKSILMDEKFIGNSVYNKVSRKLKGRKVFNSEGQWIRAKGVFEPIVERGTFEQAQNIIQNKLPKSDEFLLGKLQQLLSKTGALSAQIVSASPGMPAQSVYWRRFGSLGNAFKLIGYKQPSPSEIKAMRRVVR